MTQPLVTIVTAAYKTSPRHLRAALESAAQQTWQAFELIVSDDSPDDSLGDIVSAMNDRRFRYRHNRTALGVARNHWTCVREAKGSYIAVLNHDDRVEPDFLATLVPPLEADRTVALAFCDHWVIDAEGHVLADETDLNSEKWGRAALRPGVHRPFGNLLVTQTIPMAMGAVFRRDLLPSELLDSAGPAYDLWLTYWLCRGGLGAFYVAERLSSWRMHPVNLTSQAGADWAVGAATCWATIARDPGMQEVAGAARRRAALAFYECARGAWRTKKHRACAAFALGSLSMRITWRGVAALALASGLVPAPPR